MKIINSWKSPIKQNDKIHIKIRLSFITLFEFYIDISNKDYIFTLFNISIRKK